MCPNCRAFITTSDKVCPYCDVKVAPRAVEQRSPGDIMGGLIPHARFTTILILLINTALYIAQQFSPVLTQAGASLPWIYERTMPWRLVTAGFLHGGIIHILMNSWVLFDLGAEVEQFFGTSRMIVFYFFSTITGFWASSVYGNHSLGSSAGIYGLIGAMLAFGVTEKTALGSMVKSLYTRWLIYGLVLSFIPGIDLMAHLGGFAGGFAAAFVARTPVARLAWKEPLLKIGAGVSVFLTAVCFALMLWSMSAFQ
jgi:rhomboid protease GluP